MIKKGTRYLLLPLLFLSIWVYAGVISLKPVKGVRHISKQLSQKSAPGHIISFKIPQQIAAEVIDENQHFIAINVHAGIDVTAITPTILLDQPGSTVSPSSGVTQDFSGGAIAYIVDGATYYSVNLFPAHRLPAICPGTSILIPGDVPTPAGTLLWQMLNSAGTWVTAPGNNSAPDYQTANLSNTTTLPKVYTFRRSITTVGTTYDSYYDITVNPSTGISNYNITQPSPANSTFCVSGNPGTITGDTPTGGIGTYTFQWQSSINGGPFTDINSATGPDYTPGDINTTTSFRRITTSGTCTAPKTSNAVTITIQSAITNNHLFQPGTVTFCSQSGTLSLQGNIPSGGAGTAASFSYQWQSCTDGVNFTDIAGTAAQHQDYFSPSVSQTTYFRRMAASGKCTTPVPSDNVITITIQTGLSGNNIMTTGPTVLCGPGTPARITGDATTGGDGTPVYQWESSPDGGIYQPINGENGQNFDPPQITSSIYYRRTVKSGSCTTPLISNPVKFTVQTPLSANTITPTGTTSFCATGDPTEIKGSAVTGGDGTPVYFWESSTDGNTYLSISGTNQQNYDPPPVSLTTYFRRWVSSGSCSPPTPSAPVMITVTPAITANNIHAANTVFCVSTGAFTITGDPPDGGNGTFTYTWQSSTDGVNYQPINGATSPNYDSPSLTEDTWFQRVVSSGACNGTSVSTAVKITVYKAWAENNITTTGTTSFCQTGDATTITGSVPAGGDGSPQYQWQQSPDNVDAHFTDINGETGRDFDPPNLTTTTFYRRVVKGLICTTPLISTPVEIHITPPVVAGSNTINAPLITTFCTSVDPATIIGSLVQGGDGPSSIQYQWQLSTDNGVTWANVPGNGTQPDYDPDPITETTEYRRVVTSGACTTQIPSMQVVKLTIIDSPPNIAINPAAPICAGEQATLTIASPDASLTYNWYDTPTRDNLLFQGPVFKTAPLTGNQTFYAEASNGTCTSPQLATVDVTVNPLPQVPVLADAAPTGCKGSPVSLKVDNSQNGITYKWYTALTGGTSLSTGPEFTTPALTGNAIYYVEATNSSGCISASRASAVITVYPLPVATAQGASICPGTVAVLTANNPDPDEVINWYDVSTGGTPISTGSTFTTPVLNSGTSYYAEAVNTVSGCISATRAEAKVQMLTPLPAPVVHVTAAAAPDLTFTWVPVDGAIAYQVSIDNGVTFTDPSPGADGTSHTVTGLQVGQKVTIVVRALGNTSCETSAGSNPLTGVAAEPNVDKIFVANAFTPNGDGKNDIVYVHNDNIKSLKFSVYDQWGNMLFQSLSPQKGWDGTYKGKLQPVGVYVYYLEAIMNDGQPVTKKGTITLLR
ncbi:MAG: gliding motility-associated C-terminal domain-containing protein [Mucilaginibacter sp.]